MNKPVNRFYPAGVSPPVLKKRILNGGLPDKGFVMRYNQKQSTLAGRCRDNTQYVL